MAWIDDFTIDSTRKTIRHTSGTVVYSVNVQYSAIKDWEDDPANMTHQVAMTAQTPTEYTVVNGWFIDNPSTTFLNGGAIKTSGYLNEIQRVVTTAAGTSPIAGDLGKVVTAAGGGTPGILLHFDLDENDDGTLVNVWYCRAGDGTAYSGAMTIAAGTGAQTVSTSVDGEEIWTNVFSFGVLGATTNPQFYIEQILNGADHRLIEWVANSNFSRGNMDVLVRTQVEGDTAQGLDNLLITVRQPGTTYDSSEQTLNGQRNPFALNTADDPDNLTSEWYVLFDGETGTDIAVGDTITADSKAWYAEVTEVVYFAGAVSGYMGLRGLNESIDAVADNDVFTSSGTGTASINGTAGDKIVGYDAEAVAMTTLGQIVTGGTSGAKSILKGIDDNGTNGFLCLGVHSTIDYAEDTTYYDLYVNDEVVTGATEGNLTLDLTGGASPADKQLATSGLTGKIEFVFHHGELEMASNNLTVGMHVTQVTSGATGIVTDVTGTTVGFGNTSLDFTILTADIVNDDDSAALGTPDNVTAWVDDHTTQKAFSQATLKNYDVVVFLNGETVQRGYEFAKFLTGDGNTTQFNKYDLISAALVRTPVNGQFYLSAYKDQDTPTNTYDKVGKRSAPLGTFAGGTWFTARGLWLQDVAGADAIKFQLIDSDNVVQNPPNFVQIQTTNNAVGDQQGVYEDDGTGLVKKTQYNSHATNNAIATSFFDTDGTPAISLDSPPTGWLIVVDDSSTSGQVREHAYYYDSFSGDIFTLDPIADSIGTAGAGGLIHTNAGRNFTTDGVRPGMTVRNVTDGSIGIIASVGTTTFTVKQL